MKEPRYETMPAHFMLCFNTECPLAENCLRQIVAQSGRQTDELVWSVNPARNHGKKCRHYMPNEVVQMAYGMKNSFHEIKADDIAALRGELINHFGNGSYYLRRSGKRPITPAEQEYIQNVFKRFGYEATFDRLEETTKWV